MPPKLNEISPGLLTGLSQESLAVIVCGGRDFCDRAKMWEAMNHLCFPGMTIVHGAAKGADGFAAAWAVSNRYLTWPFPADWDTYGKAAGPIRNQKMLDTAKPIAVIAFPGGKGTAHMVSIARQAGVPVVEVL